MKWVNLITLLIAVLLTGSAYGQKAVPLESREDMVDAWSALMYCQAALREPVVSGRVYAGDIARCDDAGKVLVDQLQAHYSAEELQAMQDESAAKARASAANTRDLQEAVTACRQQCRGMTLE